MFAPVDRPASAPLRALPDAPSDPLADLTATIDRTIDRLSGLGSADATALALRAADRLTAFALTLLARGGFGAAVGMPPATMLQLDARRTSTDARVLCDAAGHLSTMPLTRAAFDAGSLSWSEVRAIVRAVRPCNAEQRTRIDALVNELVARGFSPDELTARVDHEVAQLRADLHLAREDRLIANEFLAIQGRLDGSSQLYGELGAESTATLVTTLDLLADRPARADDEDAPSRAQQRAEALVALCEERLAGGEHSGATTRPRPRLLATIDLDRVADGISPGAQLLWDLAGRAPLLSQVTADMLLCDAEVLPVIFREGRPVAVGGKVHTIPSRLRAALIARDGRCRGPGCRAPVGWTDVHHIVSPNAGGATDEDNCVLLCRRCHRLVHRYGWKITIEPDGVVAFRRGGRRHTSQPAARLIA